MSCGLLGPELGSQVALCFTGTFQTCHRESGLFTPCRVGSKPSVCDVALIEFSARVWRSRQEPRATFVSTSRGSTGVVRGLGPLVVRSTPKGRVAEVPSGLQSPPEVALTAHGLRALGSEAGSMQRAPQGAGCRVDPLMPTPTSGQPCRCSLHAHGVWRLPCGPATCLLLFQWTWGVFHLCFR